MFRNYFKIGQNSNATKFLKMLKLEKDDTGDTQEKNERLMNGAVQAFAEGRPENIQTAIANKSIVGSNYYGSSYYYALVPRALLKVTQNSKDKLEAIGLALEKVPDKQAELGEAITEAIKWNVGGTPFYALLLEARISKLEKLPEQNGEFILRETLDIAIKNGIGGQGFFVSLLKAGLPKVPDTDKERVLSDTLNIAVQEKTSEPFLALLLKLGADANAKINGHAGSILVNATCNKSPISVIELLHKNGASFDDALTTMHGQGYAAENIDMLKFYQEKIEGGKTARAAIEAVAQAVAVVEPVAAERGDVRDILLQILAQVKELTEYVKRDETETPAPRQKPQQKRPYPTVG